MKAYKDLIKHSLAQGFLISVWDGEEWQVKASKKYKEIVEAIESVEEASIRILDAYTGNKLGSALVSAYGLEDEETVIDHTDNDFLNNWWDNYYSRIQA